MSKDMHLCDVYRKGVEVRPEYLHKPQLRLVVFIFYSVVYSRFASWAHVAACSNPCAYAFATTL